MKVKQGDGSYLFEEKYVVTTLFSFFSGGDFLDKFPLDVEVLEIGERYIVLNLS